MNAIRKTAAALILISLPVGYIVFAKTIWEHEPFVFVLFYILPALFFICSSAYFALEWAVKELTK